ncbi:MAG: hypothetical protein ACRDV6_03330 [Acidimicrobiales bacterium]
MTDEVELAQEHTALVAGATDTKMGTITITSDRVVFDQKFSTNAAFGALSATIATAHPKRHEEGGPFLQFPLASITRVAREKMLLNKERIRITTIDGDYLFNDGWSVFSPALRQALIEHHRRRVVEDGAVEWEWT